MSPNLTLTFSLTQSILALTIFKKGLPNIMGQKLSCCEPSTRKSVGYLILPHKTSTSLTIPSGVIVSLFASLIVPSISSTNRSLTIAILGSTLICSEGLGVLILLLLTTVEALACSLILTGKGVFSI